MTIYIPNVFEQIDAPPDKEKMIMVIKGSLVDILQEIC